TEQLVILAVGATVVAMMKRNSKAAMQAKQAAARLIAESQLGTGRSPD
ncbi:hypothetical protein L8106_25200, partial [Lyngbya sp. PCC 8106]